MNTKRVTGWVAFFGVAAALAWLPAYFSPSEDADSNQVAVATPGKTRGALPASTDYKRQVADLYPNYLRRPRTGSTQGG